MLKIDTNETAKQLAESLETGEGIEQSLKAAMDEIAERVRADYADFEESRDMQTLAERGYRQLTSNEVKFYEGLAAALKSDRPRQAFADFISADWMPETIWEDVFRDLEQEHPLLQAVNFQYVGYATKWLRNKTGIKKAVWGKITAAINEEITGSIDTINVANYKLTSYAIIPLDILDMGPNFIDAFIRGTLKEAAYEGMEYGIIQGSGHDEPIGMMRDVHVGVSVDSSTGYPAKTAVNVTSLRAEDYNALVAACAKTEFGKARKFDKVYVVMSLNDYLTKWQPAVPSQYIGGPREMSFNTEVLISNQLPASGKAVMFIPNGYEMFVGGTRNGIIEFSDDYGFLADARYFKMINHGDGRAIDNTACLYLDINGLRPFVPKFTSVKNDGCRLESYSVTISDVVYPFVIDHVAKTGTVTVPNGSTITGLAGTFVLSEDASAKIGGTAQVSGTTTNNWTSGTAQNFVVTAENGIDKATYALTITVAASA